MNLFPKNPGQNDPGQNKPSILGPKFLMMIVFTIVIGGLMLNFFQQGRPKSIEDGESATDESFLDGTPFDVFDVKNPFGGEFAIDEDPDDPLTSGKGEVKARKLEPFVEKPEVLAGAAGRDRKGGVETFGRIQEEGVVYLAHKLRSEQAAGKAPGEPVLNTAKDPGVVKKLLEDPDRYRGKLIELRANIVREEKGRSPLQVAALPSGANPLDVNRLYRSYAYDQNEQFHLVYTIEDQSEDLEHMADVVLRGYFCRLYTGEVDLGRKELDKGTIPLLVATSYKKMSSASATPAARMDVLLIAIVLILGVLCISAIVIIVVNRKSDSDYEERRRASREKASSAKAGAAEEAAPAEDDDDGDDEADAAAGDASAKAEAAENEDD